MSYRNEGTPSCDMERSCGEPVTMIDQKGFAYCARHGMERRFYVPCRKLRPHELRRLWRGEPLTRY